MADGFSALIQQVGHLDHQFSAIVDTGFLVFARILGFMIIAPVFGRKDLPFNMKLSTALMFTCVLLWVIPVTVNQPQFVATTNPMMYTLQVMMNATVGAIIGFISAVIMEAINSAGSLMNNQIGLSSAMMFDPSSRQQVALIEKLTGFIGLMVFLNLGGLHWLIDAIYRSFEIFPVSIVNHDIAKEISLDYVVQITGNALMIGLQLISPIMLVTMSVDVILGIVNRTAQQIQVFQLSFALKPGIGMAVFLATLPFFIKAVENYLSDYARIF